MGREWLVLVLAVGILAGCTTSTRPVAPERRSASELNRLVTWDTFDPQLVADAIFLETNRIRRAHRLRPLKPDPRLDAAADLHASTLALLGQPSHGNPLAGQATPFDRAISAGAQAERVAENVATTPLLDEAGNPMTFGQPPVPPSFAAFAQRVVQQWMDSPPHRVNILARDYTHLACGSALARGISGHELAFSVQVFMVRRAAR